MEAKDLEKLVEMLWRTTLVVDDRIRVKTLAIPWKTLSSKQQSQVVEQLKRLLIAELKKPSDKALRLEFESIPKKLREMLVDIAGEDNPDLTWGRIGDEIP
jgi:hypothetical protein